jgi:4-amino-4-deoxy-L-arabinose transferase-like glycosyltransferase
MGKDATASCTPTCWDLLAIVLSASMCLFPNLGEHSLWDVDEARNAECAREMWEAGDWIVPTFNFELRTDKPILPYWAMMLAFACGGVNEWMARLPSAFAALATSLLTWWLGREMFGRWAGLLAGLLLPGAVLFNVLGHAVTPDALLILWTTAAFTNAWWGTEYGNRSWLAWFGLFTGLATLTKGLVGVLLPMTAVGLFLIWERKLSILASRWLILGVGILLTVALPWYIAVGVATKGDWLIGFFGRHHLERFTSPLEGHSGGIWYHPLMLQFGFAPWSGWLLVALWLALRELWRRRRAVAEAGLFSGELTERLTQKQVRSLRFLLCWISTWIIFFSCAQTKLPNYIAPIYPALALLCGWWLASWTDYRLSVPDWLLGITLLGLGIVGLGVSAGLVLACGWIPLEVLQGRTIPGLAWLTWLGAIPILGAGHAWKSWRADRRRSAILGAIVSGLLFVAVGAAFGPVLVDSAKISHRLGQAIAAQQKEPEIRVACYGWFQPSVVFYVGRPIANLRQSQHARDWLEHPLESYLIVSEPWWEERLLPQLRSPYTVLGCYWDFSRRRAVLLVVNRPERAKAELEAGITPPAGNTVARDDARRKRQAEPPLLAPGLHEHCVNDLEVTGKDRD